MTGPSAPPPRLDHAAIRRIFIGLMLAMFQIPNKFFERDGRVTDANGQDWESIWGEVIGAE